jgi:hypothetical protein
MLEVLADAVHEPSGNLKVTRNGTTLVLRRPRGKELADAKEVTQVRHFLERSGTLPPPPAPGGSHRLVVIDHREARVYPAQAHGTSPARIIPDDADGAGRYLHRVDDDSNGQRKPELKPFYEAVAKALGGAEEILLFGGGTGASSAMEHLLAELRHRHPDLAGRVIGSVVVDERHLTEDQLLAKARAAFAGYAAAKSSEEVFPRHGWGDAD